MIGDWSARVAGIERRRLGPQVDVLELDATDCDMVEQRFDFAMLFEPLEAVKAFSSFAARNVPNTRWPIRPPIKHMNRFRR